MTNLARQIQRQNEKEELKKIHKLYKKKPKEICPKCRKKSLFMTNQKGEVFCIRCDKIVTFKK